MKTLRQQFLENSENTGRFIVTSPQTGIQYFVEVLSEGQKLNWGDVDPATKATTGSYGAKHPGSVKSSDSMIQEGEVFKNVIELEPGVSPYAYIEEIDNQRYREGIRPRSGG